MLISRPFYPYLTMLCIFMVRVLHHKLISITSLSPVRFMWGLYLFVAAYEESYEVLVTHVTYVGGSLGFRTESQTQTTSLIELPACQRDGNDRLVCVCDGPFLTSIYSDCLQVIWGAFIEVWLHLWLRNDLVLKVFRVKPYHRVTTDESASQKPVCWCWPAKYNFYHV